LYGGKGNDTFIVDNTGDVVNENTGEGTDLVKSSVSYTLSADVENLTLTGTGTIDGIGNNLNNVITGNDSGNFLEGGLGNDTLIGGKGNDSYYVEAVGDKVVEAANGGIDTINAFISFNLNTTPNVEN